MNIIKHLEFFNPDNVNGTIHILGCGATGSTIAELLTRFGCKNFKLYDMDYVEGKNIANQMFRFEDIGKPKTEALSNIMKSINPEVSITVNNEGYQGEILNGYVFLCVDNIEVHKQFVEMNKYNNYVKAVFETRMELLAGQHYAAVWNNLDDIEMMIRYQDFTHEEAVEATPVAGCNEILSLVSVVRTICSVAVSNFVKVINNEQYKRVVIASPFNLTIDAF